MKILFETALSPDIKIFSNKNLIFNERADKNFTLEITNFKKADVSIYLFNKTKNDTILNQQGSIIKDKFLKIVGIVFENIHLNEETFLKYYDIQLHKDNTITKTNFLGFNSPAFLNVRLEHIHNIIIKQQTT